MKVCSDCGGTVIEYDIAAGNGFCVKCGTVVEEGTIVNEVSFGETAGGAAIVQGSYVAQGSTHARMSGPFGNRGHNESREQTIANAARKIQSIANILRLSDVVCLAATRLYTLAIEHKFTKGRKSLNIIAVCLYVACRQKETRNYMLIDFSDLLQVNVFELGHTYLQLVQTLNLRLPLVDPSHYISRFAALLEFGDETSRVAHDAVRLVQRFDRDWLTRGRRPAGICGAALLLAARMNNFRRSVAEVVQVVKIADTTLKKRLEEFKASPSSGLTLQDFRNVWLEEEMNPPAFTRGREKEEAERREREEGGVSVKGKEVENPNPNGKTKRKRKRKIVEDEQDLEENEAPQQAETDFALLNSEHLESTIPLPLFIPEYDGNIDPALLSPLLPRPSESYESTLEPAPSSPGSTEAPNVLDLAISEELAVLLNQPQGIELSSALEEAERRRLAQIEVGDELGGLDEDELDAFILTQEEVRIKERVWVELNKDYLEAIAAKGEQQETGAVPSRKRRKSKATQDTCSPSGSTAAESVKNLMKKNPKYSKRINYDALKDLFVEDDDEPKTFKSSSFGPFGSFGGELNGRDGDGDDETAGLYRMRSMSVGVSEGGIVEEEGGGVGTFASARKGKTAVRGEDGVASGREEEVYDVDDLRERVYHDVDDDGWEDGYEQEV